MLSMLGGRNWSPILPLDSRGHCALLAAPAQIMHNVQASRSLPVRVERMRCPIKALQIWRAARLQHSSPVKIKRNPLGDNTVAWRSMHRHILGLETPQMHLREWQSSGWAQLLIEFAHLLQPVHKHDGHRQLLKMPQRSECQLRSIMLG